MESTENIDFQNYWCVLKRRWLPAVTIFGVVVGLTTVYTFLKVPIYNAQGKLLFKQEDKTSSLIGLDLTEQGYSQNTRLQATEAQIIRSTPVLQKTLNLVNQNNPQRTPLRLRDLQQGLNITNVDGTDILEVNYKSTNPQIAALVVNQLMNAYINNDLLFNRAATIATGNFISAQLPKVKANVYRAEAAVQGFKEKHKITDLGQTQTSVAASIERIGAQLDSSVAQLAILNSQATVIQNKLGVSSQQAMAVSSVSQSPAVQGVLTDFLDVQRALADARSRYPESHPTITRLRDKEAQLKPLLQDQVTQILQGQKAGHNGKLHVGQTQESLMADLIRLDIDRVGLATQKAALSHQQAFYQRKAAILPRLEQQYREYQRELSAAESTYETLLKNLQESEVIKNRTVGNVRILETAQVPRVPTKADKTSAMAAGALAGILLALAVLYILESTDKKIKTVKEAKEIFEYTLLGTIPVFGKTTKTGNSVVQTREASILALPVIANPRSSISESYRMLRTNLKFSNSDQPLKVIVVTSSVPKEGKSTTCANLAAVMAQLDYRVLIIDADMRHPSQHDIWQIANKVGLMNVVAGQASFSRASIQPVMNKLYILTAGVSTSNPDVFLDSKNMEALINRCRNKFDYVIIDTPPLSIAADATILGKMADGVMIVTRSGLADSVNSKSSKEYLDQSGQNILGIVVNAVLPENEPYSYYHYYAKK